MGPVAPEACRLTSRRKKTHSFGPRFLGYNPPVAAFSRRLRNTCMTRSDSKTVRSCGKRATPERSSSARAFKGPGLSADRESPCGSSSRGGTLTALYALQSPARKTSLRG